MLESEGLLWLCILVLVDEGYFWACIVANLIVCARIALFLYKQGQHGWSRTLTCSFKGHEAGPRYLNMLLFLILHFL